MHYVIHVQPSISKDCVTKRVSVIAAVWLQITAKHANNCMDCTPHNPLSRINTTDFIP